jgi:hypothetical protein
MENEKDYTFNGQRPGEVVHLVLHRHPYTIYRPGFWSVILLTIVLTIILFWPGLYYLAIAIFLGTALFFYNAFYSFKESELIVTDQRLFSVTQSGFFKRLIVETELRDIIDVRSSTKGFFKTVLHYGDLMIRNAGANEEGDIIIEDVPDPYFAQQTIAKLKVSKTKKIVDGE